MDNLTLFFKWRVCGGGFPFFTAHMTFLSDRFDAFPHLPEGKRTLVVGSTRNFPSFGDRRKEREREREPPNFAKFQSGTMREKSIDIKPEHQSWSRRDSSLASLPRLMFFFIFSLKASTEKKWAPFSINQRKKMSNLSRCGKLFFFSI